MSNQIESYKKVINIIASNNFFLHAEDMLLRIAMLHPKVVVDAYKQIAMQHPQVVGDAYDVATNGYGVLYAIVNALLSGKKIVAIKEYRLEYDCDLKTAKDAIEEIIDSHDNLRKLFALGQPDESLKR